jgi:DNA-binding MarR family transcriptional regulator
MLPEKISGKRRPLFHPEKVVDNEALSAPLTEPFLEPSPEDLQDRPEIALRSPGDFSMAECVEIQSVSYRHQAIADWLLANPERKLGELAIEMNLSQSWLSVVIHSGVFKEYFAKRRMTHEERLREQITDAQLKVTLKALEKLALSLDAEEIDGRFVLDVAEKTAARLGFEPRRNTKFIEEREQTFLRPIPMGTLQEAQEKITRKIVQEVEVGTPAGS